MRELTLFRHAKTETVRPGQDDRARVLIERGRRDAASAGRALGKLGVAADAILISPSARTRETADIALADASWPRLEIVDDLYLAEPDAIWAAAMARGAERVLILGHNPGLHELASALLRQAHDKSRAAQELLDGMPTSAFAVFAIDGDVLEAAGPRLISSWRP